MLDVFVLYAPADAAFVRGYLLPALNLPPARVALVDELSPGQLILSEIERCIAESRFSLVVVTPALLADRWASLGERLASHADDLARLIPLRLTPCEMPAHLSARVAFDFTEESRWDAQTARLRARLEAPDPIHEPIACPYPGMRAFGVTDHNLFFGRTDEIGSLVGRLDRGEPEIYVIGPSGSGKSSLVQAGLLHALEAGTSILGRSFAVRAMRPGEHPGERLERLLEAEASAPGAAIDALVARHPPARRLLIFVDQLEELFTLAGDDDRRRFIRALRELRREPRCCLVFALRADFYGALMDSELWPEVGEISPLPVPPLRGAALAEAIAAPSAKVGVQLDARLCDRLVADAAHEPGVLPLLQETLRILWGELRHRYLGLTQYDALFKGRRGLDVAIERRAATAMAGLSEAQRAIARRILLRLVSFGEGRADTRRQLGFAAVRSAADDEAELQLVLQHLVEHRLITVDGSEAGREVLVDLSHEALITAWPTFRVWIEARRADEKRRRWIDGKVADWIERGRGASALLDGVELAEAEQWLGGDKARELGYAPELPALIAASREALDQAERQAREIRHLLAMTYLEQGRALLMDDQPEVAIPYLIAARSQGVDGPVIRMLFAQASKRAPMAAFLGHRGPILAVAFSPDGTRVVTASQDKTARVWDARTGEPVGAALAHRGAVFAAAFDHDGARVATASDDATARIWDAVTGEPVGAPYEHHGAVMAVAFSPDDRWLVTATEGRQAHLWSVPRAGRGRSVTGGDRVLAAFAHRHAVEAVAFSPDGARIVTASWDKTARIWDASGPPATPPLKHRGRVIAAAFSADGTRVVTACEDGRARVWHARTGKLLVSVQHEDRVEAAAFSPDGTRIVTASADATARVWSAANGAAITPPLKHQGRVMAAVFSPDGERVATASTDKTALIWLASTGDPSAGPLRHDDGVPAIEFSPDGERVVTASWDGTARVWSSASGIPMTQRLAHRARVTSAAFSRDGARVVTASHDSTARVWDAASGAPVTPPLTHRGQVTAAVFSPDGARVVTASRDATARIWDAATGEPLSWPLDHQLQEVTLVAFNRDGSRFVTATSDGSVRVWDPAIGAPMVRLEHSHGAEESRAFSADGIRVVTSAMRALASTGWQAVRGRPWHAVAGKSVVLPRLVTVAFASDGSRVLTASSDGTVRAWTAISGELVDRRLDRGVVLAAAFSADGARVATAGNDNAARIWDVATGAPRGVPLAHQGLVWCVAFSADGTQVVTASADHTARIWSAASGAPLTGPLLHRGPVWSAAFSADATRVVTASEDRTVRVWDAATGKPVTQPLVHRDRVTAAVFGPDGARVVTASDDRTAQLWTLPIDTGSLEDWQRFAKHGDGAASQTIPSAGRSPPRGARS